MRDFAKIVQNILATQPKDYKGKEDQVVRLWAHECHRVWRDRLISTEDIDQYSKTMSGAMKGALLNGDIDEKVIF
jgi:dynein heavy chain